MAIKYNDVSNTERETGMEERGGEAERTRKGRGRERTEGGGERKGRGCRHGYNVPLMSLRSFSVRASSLGLKFTLKDRRIARFLL